MMHSDITGPLFFFQFHRSFFIGHQQQIAFPADGKLFRLVVTGSVVNCQQAFFFIQV